MPQFVYGIDRRRGKDCVQFYVGCIGRRLCNALCQCSYVTAAWLRSLYFHKIAFSFLKISIAAKLSGRPSNASTRYRGLESEAGAIKSVGRERSVTQISIQPLVQ